MSTAPASQVESSEPRPAVKTFPGVTNNALLGAACAVLLLAPLCFGAVQWWAIFALETSATVLFALWTVRQSIGKELSIVPNPLYVPMLAFIGLAVLQYLLGTTAYRYATYSHLQIYAAYGMLAFVITQTLRRSSQLRILSWTVCAYGGIVAFLSLLQGISQNGKLFWIWALDQNRLIYGPYVNHNHYAGLMELLTPFPLVLAVSRFTHRNQKLVAAGIGALMAGTIFLSGSRGGMIAFAVQVLALIALVTRKQERTWNQEGLLIAVMVIAIAGLFWLGGNQLAHRVASIHTETRQELSGGTRLSIDRDSLRMWTKHPLLGWGLGAFPEVYPQFRSFYTSFFVNQAHNDYLQLLVETGLAGFAIALWFLLAMLRRAIAKLKNWTETPTGVLTAGCLLACIGILIHSFLDFNLQIPANAALFYVLCAIAAAESVHESSRRRLRRRSSALLEIGPPVAEPEKSA